TIVNVKLPQKRSMLPVSNLISVAVPPRQLFAQLPRQDGSLCINPPFDREQWFHTDDANSMIFVLQEKSSVQRSKFQIRLPDTLSFQLGESNTRIKRSRH